MMIPAFKLARGQIQRKGQSVEFKYYADDKHSWKLKNQTFRFTEDSAANAFQFALNKLALTDLDLNLGLVLHKFRGEYTVSRAGDVQICTNLLKRNFKKARISISRGELRLDKTTYVLRNFVTFMAPIDGWIIGNKSEVIYFKTESLHQSQLWIAACIANGAFWRNPANL